MNQESRHTKQSQGSVVLVLIMTSRRWPARRRTLHLCYDFRPRFIRWRGAFKSAWTISALGLLGFLTAISPMSFDDGGLAPIRCFGAGQARQCAPADLVIMATWKLADSSKVLPCLTFRFAHGDCSTDSVQQIWLRGRPNEAEIARPIHRLDLYLGHAASAWRKGEMFMCSQGITLLDGRISPSRA